MRSAAVTNHTVDGLAVGLRDPDDDRIRPTTCDPVAAPRGGTGGE
jgi:hypothetical protein